MYACGLTAYARGHIGNFRTFVCLDVLRRTLKYVAGFDLPPRDELQRMSTTRRSRHPKRLVCRCVSTRRGSSTPFGRTPPRSASNRAEEYPRATDEDNLRAMVETIQALEARGHTYRRDGSIYFKIDTLPDYGKLARLDHAGIQSGARVDSDQYEKAGRSRLCSLESHRPRRAVVGSWRWSRSTRVAHRVLGDGHEASKWATD